MNRNREGTHLEGLVRDQEEVTPRRNGGPDVPSAGVGRQPRRRRRAFCVRRSQTDANQCERGAPRRATITRSLLPLL